MAKTPEMDADFARVYAETFMEEGPVRTQRWKGVVDTCAGAGYQTAEVLVRYAFETSAPPQGSKNENLAEKHLSILTTIAGGGGPMNPQTSRRELQVLSAMVLKRLFATLPDAPIAVLNASFVGQRTADLPMDLRGLASQALLDLSKRQHARADTKAFKIVTPKIDFELEDDGTAEHSVEELHGLRDAAQTAIQGVVDGQNRVAELLARQIALGDEELQMLWWLIGGHCRIVGAPFTDLDPALKPLVLSKELAELTMVSPGPASVAALFARAGLGQDEVKVVEAVNAVELDLSETWSKPQCISPVTTPLHFAVERRVEIGSDLAWPAVWSSMTGLSEDASLPAIELAQLFYREHLFLFVGA